MLHKIERTALSNRSFHISEPFLDLHKFLGPHLFPRLTNECGRHLGLWSYALSSSRHWRALKSLQRLSVALTFVSFIAWAEPENTTADVTSPIGWNTLSFSSSTELSIGSDTGLPTSGFGILLGNGDTGNVNTATESDFYTFNDSSDRATSAPDSGSTFGLLILALAGLFGASRLRSLRLA